MLRSRKNVKVATKPKKPKLLAPINSQIDLMPRKSVLKRYSRVQPIYVEEQEEELEMEYEGENEEEGNKVESDSKSSTYDNVEDEFEPIEPLELMGAKDLDFDSTSYDFDETSSDDFSYLAFTRHATRVKKQHDFFHRLGRVPNIDDISLTSSTFGRRKRTAKRPIRIEVEAPTTEITEAIESEGEEEEEVEGFIEEYLSTEYSELDYEIYSTDEEVKAESDEDIFEKMASSSAAVVVAFDEPNPDYFEILQARDRLNKDANDFLYSLIDAIVDIAEYVDPKDILRSQLDKVKLFKKLLRSLDELYSEKKVTEFLNLKCVQHYRRIKDFRPITPETEETLQIEQEKNKQTFGKLNCLLTNEINLKVKHTKEIGEFEKQAKDLEAKFENSSSKLEKTMRNAFAKRSDSMKRFLENKINEMTKLRKDISILRENLISRQHVDATFKGKLNELENVGDKNRLRQFERMFGEEGGIYKRIEDKTDRLLNVRRRFNDQTTMVAHVREKQNMVLLAIRLQLNKLSAADIERQRIRKQIHKLRLNRIHVQNGLNEIHYENGLIGKPNLLADFDVTIERGQQLRTKIDELKHEISRLEKKISSIQKRAACKEKS